MKKTKRVRNILISLLTVSCLLTVNTTVLHLSDTKIYAQEYSCDPESADALSVGMILEADDVVVEGGGITIFVDFDLMTFSDGTAVIKQQCTVEKIENNIVYLEGCAARCDFSQYQGVYYGNGNSRGDEVLHDWTYDSVSNTLTLDNCNITYIEYMRFPENVTIEFDGNCSISLTDAMKVSNATFKGSTDDSSLIMKTVYCTDSLNLLRGNLVLGEFWNGVGLTMFTSDKVENPVINVQGGSLSCYSTVSAISSSPEAEINGTVFAYKHHDDPQPCEFYYNHDEYRSVQDGSLIHCIKIVPEYVGDMSASLTLSDNNIDLNFYMTLLKTIPGAYAKLTDETTSDVEYLDVSDMTKLPDGRYKVPYSVPAKNMSDKISVQFFSPSGKEGRDDDTLLTKKTEYSVKEYCSNILKKEDYSAQHDLVSAILNYGAASQKYFKHNTENPANEGVQKNISDEDTVNQGVQDAPNTMHGSECLKYNGTSLLLKSQVIIRHYFTVSDNAPTGYTPIGYTGTKTIDGEENYYFDTKISPADFGALKSFIFDSTVYGNYNVNAYIKSVINSDTVDQEYRNLVCALYDYGKQSQLYADSLT
ncbi:MAG: hypothetical protein Q4F95_12925 [Oscillospiraceae bacterium]|nr:hypothetical protein [Oscillospiraceae bacterium]